MSQEVLPSRTEGPKKNPEVPCQNAMIDLSAEVCVTPEMDLKFIKECYAQIFEVILVVSKMNKNRFSTDTRLKEGSLEWMTSFYSFLNDVSGDLQLNPEVASLNDMNRVAKRFLGFSDHFDNQEVVLVTPQGRKYYKALDLAKLVVDYSKSK